MTCYDIMTRPFVPPFNIERHPRILLHPPEHMLRLAIDLRALFAPRVLSDTVRTRQRITHYIVNPGAPSPRLCMLWSESQMRQHHSPQRVLGSH
jgi:hypothetical protein